MNPSRNSIQYKSSTISDSSDPPFTKVSSFKRLTTHDGGRSGEGGIRTPGPGFPGHGISSAAQSATLSPLRVMFYKGFRPFTQVSHPLDACMMHESDHRARGM